MFNTDFLGVFNTEQTGRSRMIFAHFSPLPGHFPQAQRGPAAPAAPAARPQAPPPWREPRRGATPGPSAARCSSPGWGNRGAEINIFQLGNTGNLKFWGDVWCNFSIYLYISLYMIWIHIWLMNVFLANVSWFDLGGLEVVANEHWQALDQTNGGLNRSANISSGEPYGLTAITFFNMLRHMKANDQTPNRTI